MQLNSSIIVEANIIFYDKFITFFELIASFVYALMLVRRRHRMRLLVSQQQGVDHPDCSNIDEIYGETHGNLRNLLDLSIIHVRHCG
jgi:hypothetical protein